MRAIRRKHHNLRLEIGRGFLVGFRFGLRLLISNRGKVYAVFSDASSPQHFKSLLTKKRGRGENLCLSDLYFKYRVLPYGILTR